MKIEVLPDVESVAREAAKVIAVDARQQSLPAGTENIPE